MSDKSQDEREQENDLAVLRVVARAFSSDRLRQELASLARVLLNLESKVSAIYSGMDEEASSATGWYTQILGEGVRITIGNQSFDVPLLRYDDETEEDRRTHLLWFQDQIVYALARLAGGLSPARVPPESQPEPGLNLASGLNEAKDRGQVGGVEVFLRPEALEILRDYKAEARSVWVEINSYRQLVGDVRAILMVAQPVAGGGREPGGRGRSTESGAPALAHNAGPAPTASSELGPALESTREVAPPSDATGVEARVASDGAVVSEAAPRPSSAHIMSRHVSVGRPEFDLQGPAPTASEQPSLDRVMEEKFGRAVYHGYLMPWPPESPSQPLESSTVEEECSDLDLVDELNLAAREYRPDTGSMDPYNRITNARKAILDRLRALRADGERTTRQRHPIVAEAHNATARIVYEPARAATSTEQTEKLADELEADKHYLGGLYQPHADLQYLAVVIDHLDRAAAALRQEGNRGREERLPKADGGCEWCGSTLVPGEWDQSYKAGYQHGFQEGNRGREEPAVVLEVFEKGWGARAGSIQKLMAKGELKPGEYGLYLHPAPDSALPDEHTQKDAVEE